MQLESGFWFRNQVMQCLAESEDPQGPCDMTEFHTSRAGLNFAVSRQTDSHQFGKMLLGEILMQTMKSESPPQLFHCLFIS